MNFVYVKPDEFEIGCVEADSARSAWDALSGGNVDFGVLGGGLHIIVYEFGLMEQPWTKGYFSMGRRLYAGRAIVFRADEVGDTIDIAANDVTRIVNATQFYPNADAVEKAIAEGKVDRPHTSVNGLVTWAWNQGTSKEEALEATQRELGRVYGRTQ